MPAEGGASDCLGAACVASGCVFRTYRSNRCGGVSRAWGVTALVALVALSAPHGASGEFARLKGGELATLREEGSTASVLILCHASAVNSPESAAALEVWRALDQPLDGLVRMAALDCDEFPSDCNNLQAGSLPRAMLLAGGELTRYRGPLTRKSVGLFATNSIAAPVAQLTFKAVPWWEASELQGRRAVVLLHEGSDIPIAFRALAVQLADTHAFAELRVVSHAAREHFGVAALPAIVMGTPGGESYRLYRGEMKRAPLRVFLASSADRDAAGLGEADEEVIM
jgi:hypothetical protein